MARTFTTSFYYNGNIYTAVISQLDGALNIYIPDESLHNILPGGKASYKLAEGLKIDRPHLSPAQHVLLSVLSSIEEQKESRLENMKNGKK
jgi:hypothetical protein